MSRSTTLQAEDETLHVVAAIKSMLTQLASHNSSEWGSVTPASLTDSREYNGRPDERKTRQKFSRSCRSVKAGKGSHRS
jgi:hypothetical protein